MKQLSNTAKAIAPSATLAIDNIAKQMKANGVDVIGFGAGEPDFATPDNIKAAGIAAINANYTKYTASAGIAQLKGAISDYLKRDFGLEYASSDICVSNGAKTCVYAALMAILNSGDEVILPAPYWVTYAEAIKLNGGVPVIIETHEEDKFKLSPEMLQNAITENTKCIILTSPSNPTGAVYTKDELIALSKIIIENDLYVIADEIYCSLTYGQEFFSFAAISEEIKNRTILINGVSKSYAMTGWRIGYTASNKEIAIIISNCLGHMTGSPSTISQYAALEAISGDQTQVEVMRKAFDERRKYFVKRVSEIDGVSCVEPKGAFYIYMNVKRQLGRTLYGEEIKNSEDFAASLLKNALVAVVPGNAFGMDGYVRWSYATSMENIQEGLDRLEKFLKEEA